MNDADRERPTLVNPVQLPSRTNIILHSSTIASRAGPPPWENSNGENKTGFPLIHSSQVVRSILSIHS